MAFPKWYTIAISHLGMKEIPGPKHHAAIIKWWGLIRAPFLDDETPWCAGFVGGCLEEAGIKSTRSAAALSYAKWGQPLAKPAVGAVAYMERRNAAGKLVGGHVAFVAGVRTDGALMLLGGNQSNAVTIAPFQPGRIIGYRWPNGEPLPRDAALPVIASRAEYSSNEA